MGRPLHKDVKGTRVTGSFVGAAAGIRVEFHDGTNFYSDGIIIKQRGAGTFVVARVGSPLVRTTCVLKDGTPNAFGQMRMYGIVSPVTGGSTGDSTSFKNIRRITKRVVLDWSGNTYTWYLENDSSADYIVLEPVTA